MNLLKMKYRSKKYHHIVNERIWYLGKGNRLAVNVFLQRTEKKFLALMQELNVPVVGTLSLCDDVARSYLTLCIEYKAKVDVYDKDSCTRNIKLRHSRNLYISLIIPTISIAQLILREYK